MPAFSPDCSAIPAEYASLLQTAAEAMPEYFSRPDAGMLSFRLSAPDEFSVSFSASGAVISAGSPHGFLRALGCAAAGREAAERSYDENKNSFLWVKNIWLPDTSYNHPVQGYNDFRNSASKVGVEITSEFYENELTANLSYEKGAANGYYILIVISIGSMFLSQFIVSKSNKAQNELQTADGRGKKTQRVMMIVMPIIFGIFSFMYSAAFSIYMIISNLFGILSTVLINLVIDSKFKKIEEREIQEKYQRRVPRHNGVQETIKSTTDKKEKNRPQASAKTQDKNSVRKGGKK